jgi:chromosome segregation ATPase
MYIVAAALAFLNLSGAVPVRAAEEDTTGRLREMLHRTQEALRQAQSENADLARAKIDAESKLKAASKDLEAARGVSKAELALRGQLQTTKAAQDELAHRLGDAMDKLFALNANLGDTTKQLATRDADLAQLKQGLDHSRTETASCEAKNLKLYSYSQDLLQAYRNKGVWASFAQKDPLLGLKEVDVENVVQEYRLKFAGQKIQP